MFLELKYLPANDAYAFTFGDQLVPMGDRIIFPDWTEATRVAAAHDIDVDKFGACRARAR